MKVWGCLATIKKLERFQKIINSIDNYEVSAVYFEYNLCGKYCATYLKRIVWGDENDDLFIFKGLSFGKRSNNQRISSISR